MALYHPSNYIPHLLSLNTSKFLHRARAGECFVIIDQHKYLWLLGNLKIQSIILNISFNYACFILDKFVKLSWINRDNDRWDGSGLTHSNLAAGRNDLFVPVTRTLFGLRSIVSYGSKIWNLLPIALRECKTIETFTRNYWKIYNRLPGVQLRDDNLVYVFLANHEFFPSLFCQFLDILAKR